MIDFLQPARLTAAIALCYALSLLACSSDDGAQSELDAVDEDISQPEGDADLGETLRLEIRPDEVDLMPGEALQVRVRLYRGETRIEPGTSVNWRVDDTEVASVSGSGEVRGVAAGQTTLTGELLGVEASVEVRVGQIERVEIAPESADVFIGQELQLAVESFNRQGDRVESDEPIAWTSSAPDVAAVDSDGVVTGLKAGDALVEATLGSVSAQARIHVEPRFVDLDCGPYAICVAVSEDGELYTVGASGTYRSADGLLKPRFEKVETEEDVRFKSAVIRRYRGFAYCALSTDDRAYCWGQNNGAELGQPPSVHKVEKPTAIDTELRFKSLVVGTRTTCALTLGGDLYCWGDPRFGPEPGKEDDPNDPQQHIEVPVLMEEGPFSALISSGTMACVQEEASGAWSCLGWDSSGQLGNGEYRYQPELVAIAEPTLFHDLGTIYDVAGTGSVCAADLDQMVWCWGYTYHSEFGRRIHSVAGWAIPRPRRTPWDMAVVKISGVERGYCGETPHHQLRCWGDNHGCMLGIEASTDEDEPDEYPRPEHAVQGLPDDWSRATANCVLSESGGIWCWALKRATGDPEDAANCEPRATRVYSHHD